MSDVVYRDPLREKIIEATGPVSITTLNDRVIITFTQASPKIDDARPGRSNHELEMIVVARLSFTKWSLNAMLSTIEGFKLAQAPTAGRG